MEVDRSDRAASAHSRYRPYLDGLRTIAVYLVVAFHAGLGVLTGGYIGVDIFFVLSGYLVTQILVRDLASVGRVRGRRFYARRVRRILPAATLTLLGTAVVYAAVASPAEVLDALGGFKAAFLYVANWYFIRQSTDYFAANVNANPVLQFWSLAVEEQFYLAWPLLLGGLFLVTARLRRWRWWAMRAAVVVAGLASAAAALYIGKTNLARAYYGTDTRAYQLLAGAAIALTPQLLKLGSRASRVAQWVSALSLVVLIGLATSLVNLGPISRGVLVAALTMTLLVALESASAGRAKQMLSSRPFTYLGRISYGVYLWHWPVIVIAAEVWTLSPIVLFTTSCAAATALAALSFRFIERPVRTSPALDRYKIPTVAIGLAASIVFGVFVMPAILDPGSGTINVDPVADSSRSGLRLLDWREAKDDRAELPSCFGKQVKMCTVVRGQGKRVVLMGDSTAWAFIPTFTEIAKQRSWNFSVLAYPTCPWQENLQTVYPTLRKCQERQTDWYTRVLPELDPDVIILSHQTFDDPAFKLLFVGPGGTSAAPGSPQFEPFLTDVSSSSLRALERPGRQIVILEGIPKDPSARDPIACLSKGVAPSECAYSVARRTTPLERFYRNEAQRPDIDSLDLDRLVCPRWPTCDAVVGDIIVKGDLNHLTATFARSLAPQIAARIPQ